MWFLLKTFWDALWHTPCPSEWPYASLDLLLSPLRECASVHAHTPAFYSNYTELFTAPLSQDFVPWKFSPLFLIFLTHNTALGSPPRDSLLWCPLHSLSWLCLGQALSSVPPRYVCFPLTSCSLRTVGSLLSFLSSHKHHKNVLYVPLCLRGGTG